MNIVLVRVRFYFEVPGGMQSSAFCSNPRKKMRGTLVNTDFIVEPVCRELSRTFLFC
jgi:hypothetical protein